MLLPTLTTALLLLALAEPPTPTLDPVPAPEPSPEFTAALDHLTQLDEAIELDPIALEQALAALADHAPEVAITPKAQLQRQLAHLNLARAHMVAGEDDLAALTMDEAIREAMGEPLPADMFGPSLSELYEQRLAALEALGHADLVFTCAKPCTVYVDETALDPELSTQLLLGSYRVWIEDPSGVLPTRRELVDLNEAGALVEVEFAPVFVPPPLEPPPPKPKGIMPRGAEIALIVVGASLTATGAVLVSLTDTLELGPLIGGALSLAVGAGVLTSGVITLSVDERKLGRGIAHQATLSWTARF